MEKSFDFFIFWDFFEHFDFLYFSENVVFFFF